MNRTLMGQIVRRLVNEFNLYLGLAAILSLAVLLTQKPAQAQEGSSVSEPPPQSEAKATNSPEEKTLSPEEKVNGSVENEPPSDDEGSYESYQDTEGELPEAAKDIELQGADKAKPNKKTIIRQVKRSDSLQGILKSSGFSGSEVYDLLALPAWPKHFVLVPGSRYLVSTFTDNPDVELAFFIPRSEQAAVVTKTPNGVEFKISDFQLDVRIRSVQGEVKGSLYSAIRNLTGDPWVGMRFTDAYSIDFKLDKMIGRGAKFAVTYEEKMLNGQFVVPGEVLYTAIELDGQMQERHFVRANEGGFFLAADMDHDLRPFFSPVEYFHISSPFNPKRFHPVRRRRIPHRGTDIALPHGSSVWAALEGVVARVGRNKAAGQFVVLKHKNGYSTEYVHLSHIERGINLGVNVAAGQKLGNVGCTGYCTRPHLHFGVNRDGEHIDPVRFLKPYSYKQATRAREVTLCLADKRPSIECTATKNIASLPHSSKAN